MSAALCRTPLRYGVVALVLFAPLIDGGTTYVPATLIRLVTLGLAVAWLWLALGAGGGWRRPTMLDLPVMLFLVLAAVSTLASAYPYRSLQAFLNLAAGALVFAVAVEVAREDEGARRLASAVVVGGVAQAVLALMQLGTGRAGRPAGTYVNPNHLAMALAMTGALLLAARPASRIRRAGVRAAVVLVGAALVATGSRGGVLAALVSWGGVAWHRWRWRAVAAAAAVVVGIVLLPNPLSSRLRSLDGADPLAYTRVLIWRSAVDRFVDHPLGVGLNLFAKASQRYAFPVETQVARYGRRAESAHSDYLQILAELGPLGLALVLWGLAALAAAARRAGGERAPATERALRLGAAWALAAVVAHAVVDTPLEVPALVVAAAALAGVLVADRVPLATPGVAANPGRPSRRLPRIAALALGAVAAAGIARHGAAFFASERASAARTAAGPVAALPWLEWAARLAPQSAEYPDALAGAALAAWRTSHDPKLAVLAERSLLRAIALDPTEAGHRARLALVYREIVPRDPALARRALERAKGCYEEAESLDPYQATLPVARAELLAQLGDGAGALAALERAVALEPRFLPARLLLARMRTVRGERKAAEAQYAAIETTLAAYPDGSARGPFAAEFLAVDRSAVHREAAALRGGSS